MKDANELPEVQLANLPSVPVSPETKNTAVAYLKALGQGVEKAIEDAERLGHEYVAKHFHAGTDPYEEERAAAAPAEESKPTADAPPAGTETGAADAETSAPAAPASTPDELRKAVLVIGDRVNALGAIIASRASAVPAATDAPTKAAVNAALVQLHDRITALGTLMEERLMTIEDSFAAHVETNHLAAHPAPPSPSAADSDAVAADQSAAAATTVENLNNAPEAT